MSKVDKNSPVNAESCYICRQMCNNKKITV